MAALLDAAQADRAVVEALAAKGSPAIQEREAAARAEGKAEGKAEGILQILEARGITVTSEHREKILGCSDLDRLNRWLLKALSASNVDEVTSWEPARQKASGRAGGSASAGGAGA